MYFALQASLAVGSALMLWVGTHLLWSADVHSFAKEKLFIYLFKYSFSCDFGGFVRLRFAVTGTFLNVLHSATANTYFHLLDIFNSIFCL